MVFALFLIIWINFSLRSDGTSSESIVFGWTYFGITASVGALAWMLDTQNFFLLKYQVLLWDIRDRCAQYGLILFGLFNGMSTSRRTLRSCSTRINMDNRRLSFVENIFIGSSIFWNRFGPTNENNAVRVCWHDNTIIQMYKAKQNGRCYLKSKTSNILKD